PDASGLGSRISAMPFLTVRSDRPVATATATIPPLPIAIASLAAHRRRPRSSRWSTKARYFDRRLSTIAASGRRESIADPARQTQDQLGSLFPDEPSAAQAAIQTWVLSASQTQAEYQTALAGAAAAHAKSFARATVNFHT